MRKRESADKIHLLRRRCYTAFPIGNSGKAEDPVRNRVAPLCGFTGLELKSRENVLEAIVVDVSLEGLPFWHEIGSFLCAFIVGVVEVLHQGIAGVEDVSIGNMVEKQQQIVGTVGERLVDLLHIRRILTNETRSGGDRAIHADALMVGAMPLSPAVSLRGLRSRIVMISGNVGESSDAEVAGIALINVPRTQLQIGNGLH